MKTETYKPYLKRRGNESKYKKRPFLRGEHIDDWDRDSLVKLLVNFNKNSPIKTLRSMGVTRAPYADPILSSLAGRPTSRKFLHYAATHRFGSWNTALRASGIDPIPTAYNKFWNKTLIVEAIQALRQAGHPLTVLSIWRDRTRNTRRILFRSTGKATTGSALHDAARRYFGSWDAALTKAGIKSELVKEKPFWTEKKIVRSIKLLHRDGVKLNSGTLGLDATRTTALKIQQSIGKKRVGRSLVAGAYRLFGSWDRALYAAGVSPLLHRKVPFVWNTVQMARVLRILYELKIPINCSSLSKDCSAQTSSVIFDCTGQQVDGRTLFRLGNQKLGSWDATLKFSGFMLSEIRRSGSRCTRDQRKVIEMIRALHKNEIALNWSAMEAQSHQLKFFIEQNFGLPISGHSILGAATDLFGSWDDAIWQSGLDVSAIRLKSRPNSSSLPVVSYQIEDSKRDGNFCRVKYLGDPSKTPEQNLSDRQAANKLYDVVDDLDTNDQSLADRVFDAILQIHHYRDQAQLIEFIVQHLNYEVTKDQVQSLLGTLAARLRSDADTTD